MIDWSDIFIPFGSILGSFRSRIKGYYNYGFNVLNGITAFNQYERDREKLTAVLSNPAVMKVFSLQCDLFSMGKVEVKQDDEPLDEDPFLDLIKHPNPFTQTQAQFLWDFMFWNMMGTSYCYVDSARVDRPNNVMYFLNPAQIEFPPEMESIKDKMIFSPEEVNRIKKLQVTYRYQDGTTFKFPFDRLVITYDLTNSVGNFWKGPSRLDALYKVISNSEHILDAQNINIRYSGKFLVGSDKNVGTNIKVGMTDVEKTDIETKIDSEKKDVWALQSMVKIQRFVSDLASLQLPEEYSHQYFLIGSMYGIPRDVLEAYNQGSTYENQEKARGAHVNYCLDPKGEQFMDSFENHFEYNLAGKTICMSWDHLPFMQIFAKDEVAVKKTTVEVLNSLLQMGVSIEQANEYLGTKFEIEEPEENEPETQIAGAGEQGENDQTDGGQAQGDGIGGDGEQEPEEIAA